MNKATLYIVAFSAFFLLGGLAALLLFRPQPDVHNVTIEVQAEPIIMRIDSLQNKVVELQNDIAYRDRKIWEFVTAQGDTHTVGPETPYEDVPMVKTSADTGFTIEVNDIPLLIRFNWWGIHKGELFEVGFQPTPVKHTLEIPQAKEPFARFYGLLGASIDQNKLFMGEFESGVVFKRHAALFGRVEGDNNLDVRIRAGAKVGLNL